MRIVRSFILAIAVLAASGGALACAGAIPLIAVVTNVASQALAWVERIAGFLAPAPMDERQRAAVDLALDEARHAATALQEAGRGATDITSGELRKAMSRWHKAYKALVALAEPLGVRFQPLPDVLGAPPLGVSIHGSGVRILTVPRPEHFDL